MPTYPLLQRLILLIDCLTPAQKRYFRMYVGAAASENTARYLKLFDAVNQHTKQEENEPEEVFVAGLLRRKVVRVHELSQVAGYLYDKILESMRLTPEFQPMRAKIAGLLQDARFLLGKELFSDCQDQLKKAGELLRRFDYPELQLELLNLERRLQTRNGGKGFNDRLDEIQAELQRLTQRLHTDNELLLHNLAILRSFVRFEPLPAESHTAMQHYLADWKSELPHDTRYRTFVAISRYQRLTIPGLNGQQMNTAQKQLEYDLCEEMMQYFNQNPELKDEFYHDFLNLLIQLLIAALDLQRFDRFNYYSVRLKNFEGQLDFYRNIVYLYLLRFLKSGEFAEGVQYIHSHRLRETLPELQQKIRPSRYAVIAMNCGILHFINADVDNAVFWFDTVLAHKPPENLPALRFSAFLLKLAAQADRPELDPLPAIDKLTRWLDRNEFRDEIYVTARVLLRHLLLDIRTNRLAATEALESLRKQYAAHSDNAHMGPFIAWAESRLTQKNLAEVITAYL